MLTVERGDRECMNYFILESEHPFPRLCCSRLVKGLLAIKSAALFIGLWKLCKNEE